ncbi:hypothetical protein FB451DRAFT_1536016 [Mycena latifolia]|nr:hypothetical protein FB451DRAFT_1536016 [Mycena latifolia]
MSSDRRLPAELERQIFELAALTYGGHTNLLLVAHRVKIWMEFLLYRVLLIYRPGDESSRPPMARYRDLIHTKSPVFVHDHVRHLFFVGIQPAEELAKILSVCGATVNVALSIFTGPTAGILPLLGVLPLERFSAYLASLFTDPTGPDFTHPLFSKLTHLDIRDPYLQGRPDFTRIPNLTHLSLRRTTVSTTVSAAALAHCTSLQVLVILFHSQSALDQSASGFAEVATDPRFVMLVVDDYKADWEVGARGGEDYWVRAEEAIKRRSAAELLSNSIARD